MRIIGYCDPMTARPGDTIRFKVSCTDDRYRSDIVRLIHGDQNPRGPGFKERLIDAQVSGTYPGREQDLHPGSFVLVDNVPALNPEGSFTIAVWIQPTTPERELQAVLAKWSTSPDRPGYGLVLTGDGHPELWLSDSSRGQWTIRSSAPLRANDWYLLVASYDAASGVAILHQYPLRKWPNDPTGAISTETLSAHIQVAGDTPLLMAAMPFGPSLNPLRTSAHFNGKIEAPSLYHEVLDHHDVERVRSDRTPSCKPAVSWDFGREIHSHRVIATVGEGCEGRTVQMPARAVTGHCWTGEVDNFNLAPEQYGAIHFHDDDLVDAGWDTDFEYRIPDNMPSGIYAARLRPGTGSGNAADEDHIPFFVLPAPNQAKKPTIAFLAPTCSYLAYANEQLLEVPKALCPNQNPEASREAYSYAADKRLLSLYDRHSDGSGVCYSSRLRPIVNLKPKFVMMAADCPHQFSADLHLVDWLETKGFSHDVLTDEALHQVGTTLLRDYRVLITGTHPEYWTRQMLDSLHAYLSAGGRLMYLGGNGFYWVTSFDSTNPHVIEIRRSDGVRTWEAGPGERYHSTTGERGGLWRWRGWPPQSLVGVGFTAQGFDDSSPYRRNEDSHDPRVSFIFDGVCDELIGDCESLVLYTGAAGFELDRLDYGLGTPPHAFWLASSTGHSDAYQHSVEEVLMSDSRQGGNVNELVRSDMVYFTYPGQGAVFSVGSIAWCGALSANNYENTVSRITENVLLRFAGPDPLP